MEPVCRSTRRVTLIEPLENRIAPATVANLNLADLTVTTGIKFNGVNAGELAGTEIASAGDFNGDGYDDLMISADAPDDGGTGPGTVYVIFGSQAALPGSFDLSTLNGTNGFKIVGLADHDSFGHSLAAGDVNGDGFTDLIIGAHHAGPEVNGTRSGATYVIFGKASGFGASFDLSTLDGTNGFTMLGTFRQAAGYSVGSGDFNGDGLADIIVALPEGSLYGGAKVVYGMATGWPASFSLNKVNESGYPTGFGFYGDTVLTALSNPFGTVGGGHLVDAADLNGDGYDDLIMGSPLSTVNANLQGAVYVLFGKASGLTGVIDATTLSGTDGFKLVGVTAGDRAGFSVGNAGDLNDDGFADLVIGAPLADDGRTDNGVAYVVFGQASGWSASSSLGTLDGNNGFKFTGSGYHDYIASSVSGAGDINNDGFADLLIGSPADRATGPVKGAAYVVYGKASGFAAALTPLSLDGTVGYRITGEAIDDHAGAVVSRAGDMNHDGKADLFIAATYSGATDAGAAFVVYGPAAPTNITIPDVPLATIATNGKSATYTDRDGDLVTVKVTKGKLTQDNFHFRAEGLGAQLEEFTLLGNTAFTGVNIMITAKPQDVTGDSVPDGDGKVNIGILNGAGINLGVVKVGGDLSQIDAGTGTKGAKAVRTVTVNNFGAFADYEDPRLDLSGATASLFQGKVDGITVHGHLTRAAIEVFGGNLTKLTVDGDATNDFIFAAGAGGGSLTNGKIGGNATDVRFLINGAITKLAIVGNFTRTGAGEFRDAGGIAGGTLIGTLSIGGDFSSTDPAKPAIISAVGALTPKSSGTAVAIRSVTIGGNVLNAQILAGYNSDLDPLNADAGIGTILVKKNWAASSIAAGVQDTSVAGDTNSTADGFGQNDTLISGGVDKVLSKIASITILGTATGSAATADYFGFTAQQIVKASINGTKLPLTSSLTIKDNLLLDETNGDLSLVEV